METRVRTHVHVHTCTGTLAHTYKHTYIENTINRFLYCYFGISLTDTVPHKNEGKSRVFRKEAETKASVFPGSPVSEVYCSFSVRSMKSLLPTPAKSICPFLLLKMRLLMTVPSLHFGFTQHLLDCDPNVLESPGQEAVIWAIISGIKSSGKQWTENRSVCNLMQSLFLDRRYTY